jgi:hypothetical protein
MYLYLTSEFSKGSTGLAHGGKIVVDTTDGKVHVTDVVAKISLRSADKNTAVHEYNIYQRLNSDGVLGVPQALGLFFDPEDEAYVTVVTHAGISLHERIRKSETVSLAVKYAPQLTIRCTF